MVNLNEATHLLTMAGHPPTQDVTSFKNNFKFPLKKIH